LTKEYDKGGPWRAKSLNDHKTGHSGRIGVPHKNDLHRTGDSSAVLRQAVQINHSIAVKGLIGIHPNSEILPDTTIAFAQIEEMRHYLKISTSDMGLQTNGNDKTLERLITNTCDHYYLRISMTTVDHHS
jgi:hypothetical protein